jgi:phosphoribosylformylglycinamidine synthase subunit PurL
MDDAALQKFMQKNAISLKISEAKEVVKLLGRNPTLTELHVFNTEWSEHCSYKSSREILKMLPTSGPTVILGPKEDAGIISFTTYNNEKYGIVISHESHNHPSQVVPFEGAATGIGGNVRDVLCMGAKVIACADPLRFGNPNGKNKERTRYIANAVVDGIAGYGNPLGVPTVAGDIYFNDSFDDNCLVNVVTLGLIKEKDIVHSVAPADAVGHDIILVGKATDNSGFGGAAFASLILDEADKESNKGAVQVPDPFLKNVLVRATTQVFKEARQKGIKLGFKDLGAGGIMCSTSELVADVGFGAEIDLDKVNVSMNIPSYIIACSETQERFAWVCPPAFTERILQIYNEEFELPTIAEGAKAVVIGKVTKNDDYTVRHKGKIVCNAKASIITKGILYQREKQMRKVKFQEPNLPEPADYNKELLKVLKHPNVASRASVFKHYDSMVQGNTIIGPGLADAALLAPIPGHSAGVALSVDSNPRYSRISPYHGAVNAVAEAMRNVAAIGAVPYGLTDCLNYGNPEKPEQFHDFVEGVTGITDAARNIWLKGYAGKPVPFVSGNVSFYNESASGASIDPSAIVACVGVMHDYSKAITMQLKSKHSALFLVGLRQDELGGSVYYDLHNELGKNVPIVHFVHERNNLYAITDAIDQRLLLSCHDISDGGMATALAEMTLGGEAEGKIGAEINIDLAIYALTGFCFQKVPAILSRWKKAMWRKLRSFLKNMASKSSRWERLRISQNWSLIMVLRILSSFLYQRWQKHGPRACQRQ